MVVTWWTEALLCNEPSVISLTNPQANNYHIAITLFYHNSFVFLHCMLIHVNIIQLFLYAYFCIESLMHGNIRLHILYKIYCIETFSCSMLSE